MFKIPFAGLELGKHEFEFEIDDKFFSFFEYSIVEKASLKAQVNLNKLEAMLQLHFHIEGTVGLECDTCLKEVNYPLDVEEDVAVKFEREDWNEEEKNEDIIVLSDHDHELDIKNLLYEYITVAIPYYPKCEMAGEECDPEMTKIIHKDLSPENKEEEIDPRWEKLKRIKNN